MSWLSKQLRSAKKAYTHPRAWLKGAARTAGNAWEAVDDIALPILGNALLPGVGGMLGAAAARGVNLGSKGRTGGGGGGGGGTPGAPSQLDQLNEYGMDEIKFLRDQARNPTIQGIKNDALKGVSYDAPVPGTPRPELGEWTNRTFSHGERPSGAIQNDALDMMLARANGGDSAISDRLFALADGTGGGGVSGYTVSDGGPIENMTERADLKELEAFDADAVYGKYAEGARMAQSQAMTDAFDDLQATRAGKGRLNTGFFNLEGGELGRKINTDFTSQNLMKAVDVGNLKRQALTDLSGLRAEDLARLRGEHLQARTSEASNRIRASEATGASMQSAQMFNAQQKMGALRELLAMRGQDLDTLNSAATYQRGDRNFANTNWENDRDFDYDKFTDENSRGERADTARTKAWESDRDYGFDSWKAGNDYRYKTADIQRTDRDYYQKQGTDAQERYMDWLSGMTDRSQGAANARSQERANRSDRRAGIWGKVGGFVLDAGLEYAKNRWGGGAGYSTRSRGGDDNTRRMGG